MPPRRRVGRRPLHRRRVSVHLPPPRRCPAFEDLRIKFNSGRAGSKDKSILIVVEGVEQQEDRIGVPQFGITAVLGDDDIFGLGIETDDAEVEVVVVVPDADLGFFRRGAVPRRGFAG